MKNYTVVNKNTLQKTGFSENHIVLNDASIVHTKLHRDDVEKIVQQGDDLVIHLKNGEMITVENFFLVYESGIRSDLVFEDDECGFVCLEWLDGVAKYQEIPGLEVLIPLPPSQVTLLPWIVGGAVLGGIGLAAGGKGGSEDKPESTQPTVTNTPPKAVEHKLSVEEDTPKKSNIIATDADGDTLTYVIKTKPANGSVTVIAATGEYTYVPNKDYHGADSFVVTVSDGELSTEVTISIDVVPVNDLPVAENQAFTGTEDSLIDLNFKGTDVDGTIKHYVIDSLPDNGLLYIEGTTTALTVGSIIDPTVKLSFKPTANWNGDTSFTYHAIDNENGKSNTGTISVTVTAVNDAPKGTSESIKTNEDTSISGKIKASDVDSDTLTYVVKTKPANGSVTVDAKTGEYTYIPDKDYHGADSFVVTVSDGELSTEVTISIDVVAVNDLPVAENQAFTGTEDSLIDLNFKGTDVDGTIKHYVIDSLPDNGLLYIKGTTTVLTVGSIIDPTVKLSFKPTANWNGDTSFTYHAIDNENGKSNTGTISVTVTAVNDAPKGTSESIKTNEDTSISGKIKATDVDGDQLSYTLKDRAQHGAVTVNAKTGEYTYVPNKDYHGPDSFVVTVSDGTLSTDVTITVDVTPVNDAPVGTSEKITTEEDTSKTSKIKASDADGDPLTYTLKDKAQHGVVTVNAKTGEYTYVPDKDYHGADSFVVTVSDGKGGTDDVTITIDVKPVNDAPVGTSEKITTAEDTSKTSKIKATDVDGDQLSYTLKDKAQHGSVNVDAKTGEYTYIPDKDYHGADSFVVTVSDGKLSTEVTISIDVVAVNDLPVAENQAFTGTEDSLIDLNFKGTDVDGTIKHYVIDSLPDNGLLYIKGTTTVLTVGSTIDPTVKLSFKPTANWNGDISFTYHAIDNENGKSNTGTISVTVTAVNDAPKGTSESIKTNEDTSISGKIKATDVDGDQLSYTLKDRAQHGAVTVDTKTGEYTYIPDKDYHGADSFVVTVSDGKGGTDDVTITIDVTSVNDAPVGTNETITTAEDTSKTSKIKASDADGDPLNYTLKDKAQHGAVTVNAKTGEYTYVPNKDYHGPDSFVVTVSDGTLSTDVKITVDVTPVNDPPVIRQYKSTDIPVLVGGKNDGKFQSGLITSQYSNQQRVHNFKFNLPDGVATSSTKVIVNLDILDNSFAIKINGEYLHIDEVFQIERNAKTTTNEVALKFRDGTWLSEGAPWRENVHDLPRFQIIIEENSVRFYATRTTNSRFLEEIFFDSSKANGLKLPKFTQGENSVDIIHIDGVGVDEIKGQMTVSATGKILLSDIDSDVFSKAKITVKNILGTGEFIPVLPQGITIKSNVKDGADLVLVLEGKASVKDYQDALNNLMFKNNISGNYQFELEVFDDQSNSTLLSGRLSNYKAGSLTTLTEVVFEPMSNPFSIKQEMSANALFLNDQSDELIPNLESSTLYASHESDVFIWHASGLGDIQIIDFDEGEDRIDIQGLLKDLGWNNNINLLGDYMNVSLSSGHTTLTFYKDNGHEIDSLIVVQDMTHDTLSQFLSANILIIG